MQYSPQTFTGGSIGFDINQVAVAHGINPATLATISSLETESLTGPDFNADSYGCNACDVSGAGATQIGQALFDNWNQSQGFVFCQDICGAAGTSQLRRNLDICAQFLKSAFDLATSNGYNDVQKMAAAGTAWNGFTCTPPASGGSFSPFSGGYGYGLPGTSQMSNYGSTAGYLYQNSGLVGSGVYDTSQRLPT